jgi:glycerate kinase
MIGDMDAWLSHYGSLAKTVSYKADPDYPGAGAAGGLGFAFLTFTNATLKPGIEIVLRETEIEADIKNADIVVTGEGCLDSQTVMGKAPIGVAKLAKKHGKKVIAFTGCVKDGVEVCNDYGIDAFFPILRRVTTLEEALDINNAYKNLTETAYQVFRLLLL